MWPIAMAPAKDKKRLLPLLFDYTQNFMGILLILSLTTENNMLKGVCQEQVNRDDIENSIKLMLEWIDDVRQLDGSAGWSLLVIGASG